MTRALRDADHIAWEADARSPDATPLPDEIQGDEDYRLYRLCRCENCGGSGRVSIPSKVVRCKGCRGEGKKLELVATCGTKEAVGVALVTLTEEGEWDECPFGLMFRPEGQTGRWLLKPWGPSAREVSAAGRVLAKAPRKTSDRQQ